MQPRSPSDALLKEAADWALALHYDAPAEAKLKEFEQWRQSSSAHEEAWRKAQTVFNMFIELKTGVGKETLKSLEKKNGRRHSMRLLGALLIAGPAAGLLAWRQLPWQSWSADMATATGERKLMTLPDGSRLVLNTASAVDMDFNPVQRRIRLLAGEILVTTYKDPSPTYRPFLVDTSHGVVKALGTRFSVRRLNRDATRASVFEKSIEVHTLDGNTRIVQAGMQLDFSADGPAVAVPVEPGASLWEQGMLLAKNMRLEELVNELTRYRHGVLRCDPSVADLRVSGAFSLDDTDAGLNLLTRSLPVRIVRNTDYWVKVTSL